MLARSAIRFIAHSAAACMLAVTALAADGPAPGAPPARMAPDPAGMPQAGQQAPEFKLQDQNDKWVTLADQKGKWVVLYFYPKDKTPGCTTQACEFRDDIFAFRKANAVILGISVDDVASHKEFSKEHGLPFSILADSSKETAKKYGVLTKFGQAEIAARETFLIDPNGKIVKHYSVGPKDLPDHSKLVLSDIDSMKKSSKG